MPGCGEGHSLLSPIVKLANASLQVTAKLASTTAAVGQFSSKLEAEQELLRQVAEEEQKEEKLVDKYSNHYGCQAFFLGAS